MTASAPPLFLVWPKPQHVTDEDVGRLLAAPSFDNLAAAFERWGHLSSLAARVTSASTPPLAVRLYEATKVAFRTGPSVVSVWPSVFADWARCGVDLNESGHRQPGLLHALINRSIADDVLALLDQGVDPNVKHPLSGTTPLMAIAPNRWSDADVLNRWALIDHGASLNRNTRALVNEWLNMAMASPNAHQPGPRLLPLWLAEGYTGLSAPAAMLMRLVVPRHASVWGFAPVVVQRLNQDPEVRQKLPSVVAAWERMVLAESTSTVAPPVAVSRPGRRL